MWHHPQENQNPKLNFFSLQTRSLATYLPQSPGKLWSILEVIIIDYSFFSNSDRNRLNRPQMKCNRNQLHCQFNCNWQLLLQWNLEIFTLHHCAMNSGCGGWVFSFIIVCYGCVSEEAVCLSMWFKSRQSRCKPSVCS